MTQASNVNVTFRDQGMKTQTVVGRTQKDDAHSVPLEAPPGTPVYCDDIKPPRQVYVTPADAERIRTQNGAQNGMVSGAIVERGFGGWLLSLFGVQD